MLENAKEYFEEFKTRLSNPFIASFVISWLVCNWKIPIALIFYKQDQLKGYDSYFDLIEKVAGGWLNILLPIIFATLYTFLFPRFRAYINEYQSRILAKSDSTILEINKESKIPTWKYIEIKNKYLEQLKRVEESLEVELVASKEKEILILEKKRLEDDIEKAHGMNAALQATWDEQARWNEVKILDGYWEVDIENKKLIWQVSSGSVYGEKNDTYKIENFFGNSIEKEVTFRIDYRDSTGLKLLYMRYKDNLGSFEGTINGNYTLWKKIRKESI